MPTDLSGISEEMNKALRELADLRQFNGAPKDFWPAYQTALAALANASKVVLVLKGANPPGWRKLGEWSATSGPSRFHVAFVAQLEEAAERGAARGNQVFPLEPDAVKPNHFVAVARLRLHRAEEPCLAVFLLSEISEPSAREALLRVSLVADVPEAYQLSAMARAARADVEKFAGALDLMAQVNAEKRFIAAALAFCNSLATRFNCERVSLGWIEGGYIKLQTISRTEKFDRQMAAAKALEVAMEEALDQDDEVVWPAPDGATVIARDHEKFAREQSVDHLVSLPLRAAGKAVAVLTCERQAAGFSPAELQQLRLCCDQGAPRLADLKRHDRWFGAQWATAAREQCAKLLGPEHTWAKVLALVIVIALAVLFFVRINYRVEGNFILRSDDVSYLTAPFDGYISKVLTRPGDLVGGGSGLLTLDTRDLDLEESNALADLVRYQREAEKARAERKLADMRIAQALADQSKARLDLVRHRLEQAAIKAPFPGVVVEGDLRERLGAPVKQGEALMKVARIDTLYVEAQVNERDIHEILGRERGEIAFVSQPRLKYPVRILKIEPAAFPKDGENVFLVRCAVENGPQNWWRPGMSGLCKLSVEKRTLFWILTHRTVDFLRLKLWW